MSFCHSYHFLSQLYHEHIPREPWLLLNLVFYKECMIFLILSVPSCKHYSYKSFNRSPYCFKNYIMLSSIGILYFLWFFLKASRNIHLFLFLQNCSKRKYSSQRTTPNTNESCMLITTTKVIVFFSVTEVNASWQSRP